MSVDLPLSVWNKIPMFSGMTAEDIRLLAEVAETAEFKVGELLLRQGGKRPAIWVLLEGHCEVVRLLASSNGTRESCVLATLAPYANFGEMSFFQDVPHSADVRAATDVRLIRLDRVRFNELVTDHSSVACKLTLNTIGSLADRLRRMDDWVAELATVGSKPPRVAEWTQFRDKLFESWTL